jgi:nucleoid-associated protein YgaU
MDGSAEERDGKLHFNGDGDLRSEKNAIWDAPQDGPRMAQMTCADIKVVPKPGVSAPVSSMKTYTVKSGDTLSAIAREYLGDAKDYPRIFEANRDQLSES